MGDYIYHELRCPECGAPAYNVVRNLGYEWGTASCGAELKRASDYGQFAFTKRASIIGAPQNPSKEWMIAHRWGRYLYGTPTEKDGWVYDLSILHRIRKVKKAEVFPDGKVSADGMYWSGWAPTRFQAIMAMARDLRKYHGRKGWKEAFKKFVKFEED